MSAVLTEQTHTARRAAREALVDALRDTGWSQRQLAAAVDASASRVGQWVDGAASTPLYLLAHAALPEGLRARLRALSPSATPSASAIETTSALLVGDVGATLHTLGAALSDGRVSSEERRLLAPLVRQLRARCDQWLARHGSDE